MASDSVQKTFGVALVLCVVCAVVVSSAAVILRPQQQENKLLDLKTNILASAGLLQPGIDVEKQFWKYLIGHYARMCVPHALWAVACG